MGTIGLKVLEMDKYIQMVQERGLYIIIIRCTTTPRDTFYKEFEKNLPVTIIFTPFICPISNIFRTFAAITRFAVIREASRRMRSANAERVTLTPGRRVERL